MKQKTLSQIINHCKKTKANRKLTKYAWKRSKVIISSKAKEIPQYLKYRDIMNLKLKI